MLRRGMRVAGGGAAAGQERRDLVAQLGVTSSSASSDRTQSPVAWSMAKFFWAAKPGQGRTTTRSVNSRAIARSCPSDSASTTTISSAQAARLQARRGGALSSLRVITTDRQALAGSTRASSEHSRAARGRSPGVSAAIVPSGLWSARCPRPVRAVARRPRWGRRGRRRRTPSAAARCSGPVSPATTTLRPAEEGEQRVEVGGRRQARAGEAVGDGARASRSSPGPHETSTCAPASPARRAASSAKRAVGQRLSGRPAPGFRTTSRSRGLRSALREPRVDRASRPRASRQAELGRRRRRCRAAPSSDRYWSTTCRAAEAAAAPGGS